MAAPPSGKPVMTVSIPYCRRALTVAVEDEADKNEAVRDSSMLVVTLRERISRPK
jgi:hypothetical protein